MINFDEEKSAVTTDMRVSEHIGFFHFWANSQTETKFSVWGVYGELEASSKTCTYQFLQNPKF